MRSSLALVVLGALLALTPWTPVHDAQADTPASTRAAKKKGDPRAVYPERLTSLEKKRQDLANAYTKSKTEKAKERVRDQARAAVLRAIRHDILPAWKGTAWDFYGTTSTPGEGEIACGYYVTTVLRDAGFKVARAKLAQQPSERITTSLVPEEAIWRFRKGDEEGVVETIRKKGDGLYLVGLDNHVGFLDVSGDAVRFCHASYADEADVRCEDPVSSQPFQSEYHVVGRLLSGPMIDAWLEGKAIETKTK